MASTSDRLRDRVRERYAEAARAVASGSECGCGSGDCCTAEGDASNFGEASGTQHLTGIKSMLIDLMLPPRTEGLSLGHGPFRR